LAGGRRRREGGRRNLRRPTTEEGIVALMLGRGEDADRAVVGGCWWVERWCMQDIRIRVCFVGRLYQRAVVHVPIGSRR
jgi:hypothetical protein